MTSEIWKPIPDYEGFYEISTEGRIRNSVTGRILKTKSNQPYYQVWLNKNGLREIKKVHQLVALTFLGEVPPNCIVNHIDLNKHNNRLDNLEYVTRLQNTHHAAINGAWSKSVSPELAQIIRDESNAGYSFAYLVKKYDLSRTIVTRICKKVGILYSNNDESAQIKKRKVKLTKNKIDRILTLWRSGQHSQHEIAREMNVSVSTVCRICNNKYSPVASREKEL